MKISQSLWIVGLSLVGFTAVAQSGNLYLRAGTTSCTFNDSVDQTLQTTAGTNQASLALSAKTNVYVFYSAPLTNDVSLTSGKKVAGSIGVKNNSATIDLQVKVSVSVYECDPYFGTETLLVTSPTSGNVTIAHNGTGTLTIPDGSVATSTTVNNYHQLKTVITLIANTNTPDAALIYNAASSAGKSVVQFPKDNSITWPFGAFKTSPDATITVAPAVPAGSTNVASVVDAGSGSFYVWAITNGTIVSGQFSRQITWKAGTNGNATLTAYVANGCTAYDTATVLVGAKLDQTISFNAIPTHTYGDAAFSLSATASSGLAVTLTVASGPATISGGTLMLTGAGTVTIDAAQAGNSTYNAAPTVSRSFTVNPANLTVSGLTANTKVYDGNTTATLNTVSASLVGVIGGDAITLNSGSAVGTFANRSVGAGKTVTVTGLAISGAKAASYTLTQPTATAGITARALTVSASAANKVYDRTTAATATLSDNRVAGDSLSTSFTSASFADKNVGAGKTVTVSGISVSGTDAANYTFNSTATASANITARGLTVTATAADKVYNGSTTAAVTLADNRVAGDSLGASFTSADFADKNIGAGKTVTVSGISISGTDAGNYSANTSAATTASITAAAVTGSVTANSKVYDGNTTATIAGRSLNGAVNGDDVSLVGGSASFADKNVGAGKTVTATGLGLSGVDAGNYTLASGTATTAANITARALTVSAAAADKVYDGSTTASVTLADNHLAGDALAASYTSANFADANVGAGKTVTVSGISITGPDAGNYSANASATATATITAATLTATVTVNNKLYDGTTRATVASQGLGSSAGGVSLVCGTADFCDSAVGSNKTVTVTGLSLTGVNAGNYVLAATTTATTASILPPAIAPLISRCAMLADHSAKIDCTGAAGQTYYVQAATSLRPANWTTISTNTIAADGTGTSTDTDASNYTKRFYRTMVTNN